MAAEIQCSVRAGAASHYGFSWLISTQERGSVVEKTVYSATNKMITKHTYADIQNLKM